MSLNVPLCKENTNIMIGIVTCTTEDAGLYSGDKG
jgi:hypothetical protein